MTLEEATENLNTLMRELEIKVKGIPDTSKTMRLKSIELASGLCEGENKLIPLANKIYQYIMDGVIEDEKEDEKED